MFGWPSMTLSEEHYSGILLCWPFIFRSGVDGSSWLVAVMMKEDLMGQYQSTIHWPFPRFLAAYMALSAALIRSSAVREVWLLKIFRPIEALTEPSMPLGNSTGSWMVSMILLATDAAKFLFWIFSKSTTNSSPPNREAKSVFRIACEMRSDVALSMTSPASCP